MAEARSVKNAGRGSICSDFYEVKIFMVCEIFSCYCRNVPGRNTQQIMVKSTTIM